MSTASTSRAPAVSAWDETVEFARRELAGHLNGHAFPAHAWRRAGSVGLPGLPVPPELGGRGCTAVECAERLEALGYACTDNGFLNALCAHLLSCVVPVWQRGSAEQRARFLRGMCRGELVAAHAATEPEAGSDVFSLRTRATRRGARYVLEGRKSFSMSAPAADLYIVFANTDPEFRPGGISAFIVERDRPGVRVVAERRKAGLHGGCMGDLEFTGCEIPEANRLGAEGSGSLIFQLSMRWERSLIAAPQVGMMCRLLEQCVAHARKRVQFGQAIGKFQSVSNRIAEMKVRLEISRLILRRAAETLDSGVRDAVEPSIAKLYISEAALASSTDAVRIHGARGLMRELEYVEDLTDALGLTILSGTSDIQRQIIARHLGL